MRKLVCMTVAITLAAAFFVACGDDEGESTSLSAPLISMQGADIDAVHEITNDMSVTINIEAPGKVASFGIEIDSPVLTDEILGLAGLTKKMDLVTASGKMAEGLKTLGFPVGDQVKNQTKLSFDISQLIPMIAMLAPLETSDNHFVLTVIDADARKTTKTLKFHHTGKPTIAYNDDADLWANTATLVTKNLPEAAKVQYRVKGSTEWLDAAFDAENSYKIAPTWEKSKNAANLYVYSAKTGTGLFAATTYQYRIALNDETVALNEFTAPAGDAISNGNMSGWSKKMVTMGETFAITYPNAEGSNFWDSANNIFLENPSSETFTPLCEEDKTEKGTANLTARLVLGMVFAPGNIFTGDFNYEGMSGTVNFGKTYPWTARPRALKVRYKAQVGKIDKVGSYDPDAASYEDQQDRSRIFVAVVDWSAQHGVTSGMVEPSGMWDPATASSVSEGAILGYGDLIITQTTDKWVEATLPINWYAENAAKPAVDKFSLVISCATSFRGDYLTGCSTNTMKVDDFQWVY